MAFPEKMYFFHSMFNSMDNIKAHYSFTNGDVKNLLHIQSLMSSYLDEFINEFYLYIKNFKNSDIYLKDEGTITRHKEAMKKWYLNLFEGKYNREYFDELEKVGMAHVRINMPSHFVNAAMHFVKRYITGILHKKIKNKDEFLYISRSVEKLLDINLDIITSSFIEEEKNFFLSQRVESYLIQLTNRFSFGLNLILVLGLVILSVLVLGLFVYDITHILSGGSIEKGLLSTLGSLLMLWVVIELIDTEITHLRGGKFAIKIFISVALVAVIRKILVTSLETKAIETQLSLVAALAVLGIVYWLIAKVEK